MALTSNRAHLIPIQVFDEMRAACPNFREKIVPIESNFDAPDLGLHEVVRNMLIGEVQVRCEAKEEDVVKCIFILSIYTHIKSTPPPDNLQHHRVS